ncbi:MAG: PilZ domain-containing protein [Candidatus Aureabacteria bacterium]|nr:PilZ domain-containing protein [Candidatus Auribacterota bacterium]
MGLLDGTGMEKRRYIRVPSHFPVRYYSVEDPAAAENPYESMSDNISVGGMMFFAEKQFRINETLRLEYKLETSGRTVSFSIFGRVVWTDEIEKDSLYNTGIEFQNLSQQQKDDLGSFVKSSLEEKRKMENSR